MSKFLTNIDLQKNQIVNAAVQNIANSSVVAPVSGQIIFDTSDNNFKFWNGTTWESGGMNGLNIIPTTGTLDIANGITLDVNNTVSFYSTNGAVVYLNSGGNVAFKDLNLAQFASTTSAQLAGIISDETGTNKLVFSNDPTLYNPVIDNIVASSTTANTDLWSEVTTGSITIGSGLTTGAVNIATGGTSATSVNVGHSQSTTTFLGNVALPSAITKIGQTPLTQGGTGAITFPSASGTLALITNIGTGALTMSIAAPGASGSSVTVGNSSGFNANSTTAVNYEIKVGPALNSLATIMANASTGLIRKIGVDSYSFDSNIYLTEEVDTLETVTTRGNSSSKIISLTNTQPNILGDEASGALIVAGGVGIGGNVSIGGNLNVDGTITYINSTEVDIGDAIILLNALITNGSQNANGGIEIKRLDPITNTAKNASIIYNETTDRWQTTFGDASATLTTATLANKGVAFVGDGTNTSYQITHNFNTQDAIVAIREVASPYSLVYADVEFTSLSTITVKFATAPTISQYKVTIIG